MQSSFNLPFIEIVTNISHVALGQFVGEHKYKAVMIKRYTKRCTNAKTKIVHRTGEEKGNLCFDGYSHLTFFLFLDYYNPRKKKGGKIEAIKLTVDSRKRISLTKLLPKKRIGSVMAYKGNDRIVLEPIVEVPA
jgi:hypothetical protein